MVSGNIQEWLGYSAFFHWVLLAAIPAFIVLPRLKYPADYGKKNGEDHE